MSRVLRRDPVSREILCSCAERGFRRSFCTTGLASSGHSKWSKIKHDKAKEDAGRSKQRSAMVQELKTISKLHGPDPTSNPRLATLVAAAKKAGLPKATMESAIARGAGKAPGGEGLESITIEAMLPPVAAIIECQTDNRLRTLADVRLIIKHLGGTIAPTSHLFERRGRIVIERTEGLGEEDILDQAIDAGATDVDLEDHEQISIYTMPKETASVSEALAGVPGIQLKSTEIIWFPNTETLVEDSPADLLGEFVDKIGEDPSVQDVYLNAV